MASADNPEADDKPSTTSLKRSRSEADLPTTPESVQKRQKVVSFNSTVNVRAIGSHSPSTSLTTTTTTSLASAAEESLAVIKDKVRTALDRHRKGDDGMYDRLKDILLTHPDSKGAPSRQTYRRYLAAVTAQAFHLGRDLDCAGLLRAMLGSYWLERDEQVWADFQRFLAALLTVHAVYLPTILHWLVDRLTESGPTDVAGTSRSDVNDRVHRTIINMSQFLPSIEPFVEESMRACFPFARAKAHTYLTFVRNILHISIYLPALRDRIIRLIMEKMLVIDASIGVNIEELDEDDMELLHGQLREEIIKLSYADIGDLIDTSSGADDNDNSEDEDDDDDDDDESTQLLMHIKQDMLKLDCTMSVLFKNYHNALSKEVSRQVAVNVNGHSSPETGNGAFESLLFAFTDVVLRAHNSRHSQYLLFRFAQLNEGFFWKYTDALHALAFDKHGSLPLRLAALSYLASFLARGAKISREHVTVVFDRMTAELEKLRRRHEPMAKHPDADLYHFYYALFQACMYVFCFRWQCFVANPDDDESIERRWHPGLKDVFTLNIHSVLNPIKVSSSLVVATFAKVAQALDFLYVFSVLESNRRVRLTRCIASASAAGGVVARETALSVKTDEEALKVQPRFAFEPYALPVSRRWVQGLYLTFENVVPAGYGDLASDDDDDDDDSEEEEDDDEDGDEDDEDEQDDGDRADGDGGEPASAPLHGLNGAQAALASFSSPKAERAAATNTNGIHGDETHDIRDDDNQSIPEL